MTFLVYYIYGIFIFISSPFLFVYGGDRLICYTGADVDTGGAEDAQVTEWGLAWGLELGDFYYVLLCFQLWIRIFGTCNTLVIYVL